MSGEMTAWRCWTAASPPGTAHCPLQVPWVELLSRSYTPFFPSVHQHSPAAAQQWTALARSERNF